MSAPLRSVDGFLSRRAQDAWPEALVYHEGGANYVLERRGVDPIGLGKNFHEARQGIEALTKAWLAAPAPPLGSAESRVAKPKRWRGDHGESQG